MVVLSFNDNPLVSLSMASSIVFRVFALFESPGFVHHICHLESSEDIVPRNRPQNKISFVHYNYLKL
jgi:hypothetical protein